MLTKQKTSHIQLKGKSCGPSELHNAHLLIYEIASLLIHYHVQVPIQRKLTFLWSSDYRGTWQESTALQNDKVHKHWPDDAREYLYHLYFYLFLSIVTTSAIAEKAKQMGLSKHCHQ